MGMAVVRLRPEVEGSGWRQPGSGLVVEGNQRWVAVGGDKSNLVFL